VFTKILVPIDGSQPAEKALETALDVAAKYEAEVEILNAFSIYRYAAILGGEYDAEVNEYPAWTSPYLHHRPRGGPRQVLSADRKIALDDSG
jgi:nucleotide-binding universal stress UspA family protein